MNSFPPDWQNLRVALSHDWLTGMRGGERVLELLCEGFPQADLYTLIHNSAQMSERINAQTIHTSALQGMPGIFKRYRYFLPLYPLAVRRMKPAPADLLLSTSHCVAKGLPRPKGARHVCYCFTPMRYAWTFYEEYFGHNPVKKLLLKPVLDRLRQWDHDNSTRVDRFVAISKHVRQRIQTFYGRDADVVYPPVDTIRCVPGPDRHDRFDLIVSALVPYKRVDIAIEAYNKLKYPLIVVGTGTEYERLRAMAGPHITFKGWASDDAILDLYQRCRVLIFPGEEDFGIVPVEAQACGKPVVAFGKGGATESILDGETGILFHEQNAEHLSAAIAACGARDWDRSHIRKNAERFSEQNFIDGLAKSIHTCMSEHSGNTRA